MSHFRDTNHYTFMCIRCMISVMIRIEYESGTHLLPVQMNCPCCQNKMEGSGNP
jgi:hypothetical protein